MKSVKIFIVIFLGFVVGVVNVGCKSISVKKNSVTSVPEKISDTVITESEKIYYKKIVNFEFDRASIREIDFDKLNNVVVFFQVHPDLSIKISGHCDERGSDEYNYKLGLKRANAVKDYLLQNGIAEYRMTIVSCGEKDPIDLKHNKKAWAKNRRVEIDNYIR